MLHNFGTHCDGSMDHHHYTTQSPKKATAFSLLSRRGERRTRRVNYISHFPPVPLSRTLWQSSRALPKPEKGRERALFAIIHFPLPLHATHALTKLTKRKGATERELERGKLVRLVAFFERRNERWRLRRGNPALLLFLIMDQ